MMKKNYDGSHKIFQDIKEGQLIEEGYKELFINSGVKIFGRNHDIYKIFNNLT